MDPFNCAQATKTILPIIACPSVLLFLVATHVSLRLLRTHDVGIGNGPPNKAKFCFPFLLPPISESTPNTSSFLGFCRFFRLGQDTLALSPLCTDVVSSLGFWRTFFIMIAEGAFIGRNGSSNTSDALFWIAFDWFSLVHRTFFCLDLIYKGGVAVSKGKAENSPPPLLRTQLF